MNATWRPALPSVSLIARRRSRPAAWLALAALGFWLAVPPQVLAATKEQMHQQMLALAQQMNGLKPSIATDATARAAYEAAEAQYKQLSDAMGGDDPAGALGIRSAPRAPNLQPRVVPAPPPNCVATTTAFTQATPTPIPTGPAVVTSTLAVAGMGPYLWDLDLTTTLTHTFSADLDITLMSPAGTVVTLTTDNGGGNDNNFNGTLWDDDANPLGQVPYTTNDGLATDSLYANLVTETPLVVEEAFGAFVGEDPNGTWTITISDDLAGDGGSLASWTLNVTTFPLAPITALTSATQATPTPIPTGPAVVTSTLAVAGAGTSLCDLNLTTTLTHTFSADLDITLMSPAGTVVTLTTDNGGGNDNNFNGTLWNDDANPLGQVPYTTNDGLVTDSLYANLVTETPLVPEEAMAAFFSENPNGTWTITISDDLAGDGGSLASWTLDITTCTCVQPCALTCTTDVTQANDAAQCGAVVNYPAPTPTGGCGTITCTPPAGSFFPVGTTTVNCQDNPVPGPEGLATCSFNVTVNDTEPPTPTCPADISVDETPPGSGGATVNFVASAADNCPGFGIACVPPSGSTFPVGTTTDTCTATDGSGNTGTCAFDVTVNLGSALGIPTLSPLGLIALVLALAALALYLLERRKRRA